MSYGSEEYGIDAYGSNAAANAVPLSISEASPVSTHSIRVNLAAEPQHISAQLEGDALNPRTWKVVRMDTGVGFTVLSIEPTCARLCWDIRVLEALASSNIQHEISSETLLDKNQNLISAPTSATFYGLLDASLATHERTAANQGFAIRDLSNPQASLPSGSTGGVYTVANGDYKLHGGTDFVRKLILRRLMTIRGGFRFLPGFGVGLQVKQPVPAGDLISLQKEIEDQVKLEPEVDKVRVSITQDENNLTIVVQARIKLTGQQISVPLVTSFGSTF